MTTEDFNSLSRDKKLVHHKKTDQILRIYSIDREYGVIETFLDDDPEGCVNYNVYDDLNIINE